jgi:chemotaxis regulatin CheY-phosphate phosphatase CheZ
MEKKNLEGKTTRRHKCKTTCLNQTLPQIVMAIDFSQLEGQDLAKNIFIVHHPF